jgi:hypothetical protein
MAKTTTTVEPEAKGGTPSPSKGTTTAVPNVEQGEKLPPTEYMAKTMTVEPKGSTRGTPRRRPRGGYVRIEGGGLWLVVLALAALALAGGSVVVSVVLHP